MFLLKNPLSQFPSRSILGDPGADSRGEGKSKRDGTKKSKNRGERAPGDNVLPDQFKVFWHQSCLVPVRRSSSPYRSIHFGDVSETNGLGTASHFRMDHATRNALAARNNEQSASGKTLSPGALLAVLYFSSYHNQHFQSSIISITKRGRFASKQGQTKSTTVEWSILSIQRFFRLIEYRGVIVKNVLLISRVGMQISIPHVRY